MMASQTLRRRLPYAIAAVAAALCAGTVQDIVVGALGGVDGSFGVRPVSHMCLGLTARAAAWLPAGDMEVQWPLHLRYQVGADRPYCFGQDVWYGE